RFHRLAHRQKKTVLRRLLGERECATHPLALRHGSRRPAESDWHQFRNGNLVGIGFGAKETEGAYTGDLAVRVYVKRKLPPSKPSAAERIPGSINGIITDVVGIGTPKLHSRPVKFGAGISHAHGRQGSLGCIVTRNGEPPWYILSACHVLAPD